MRATEIRSPLRMIHKEFVVMIDSGAVRVTSGNPSVATTILAINKRQNIAVPSLGQRLRRWPQAMSIISLCLVRTWLPAVQLIGTSNFSASRISLNPSQTAGVYH